MATRREVLQGLIISVGGAAALSACGGMANVVATGTGEAGRFYTAREMALISRLSDLIIPRTETPGALDENVPGYLDALMHEWAGDETRLNHRRALGMIAERLDRISGGDFVNSGAAAAERALIAFDAEAFGDGGEDLGGYRSLKGYITQSYFATEGGARQELKWVAVPGRWDASVEIGGGD